MRASWNGYLNIGSLKIPVQLYSALLPSKPSYVQLHAKDHSETGRVIKCYQENKIIPSSEIVKAVKNGDSYVEVSDSDLEMVTSGDKIISVRQFSDKCEIKPKYFDKPYYIVPLTGGELAYTLLRQAFVESEKIALVTYIYFQKEHLGMIHVDDGMLMLQQLRFASEIVPRSDIKTPTLSQPTPVQIDTAVELMRRYTSPFYIEDYRNEHLERVTELLERKAKGLGPKRQKSVPTEITKEESVLPAIQELLETEAASTLPRI